LLEALRLLRRDHPARLTLLGPVRRRQRRKLMDQAGKLEVSSLISILGPVPRHELVAHYHAADVALVPLVHNDRNVVQGCCPLKLIEAMATGVPLVASDLPVVRALAGDDEAILVRPGSPKAIKDGILDVLRDPERTLQRARAARHRVEHALTWSRAGDRLTGLYRELLATGTSR
jgi:glycosyltransferase involved in cell wall biosynthesis